MKKTIRLNENELRHMIMESVKNVLKEEHNDWDKAYDNSKNKLDSFVEEYLPQLKWMVSDIESLLSSNNMEHIFRYEEDLKQLLRYSKSCLQCMKNIGDINTMAY